MSSETLPTEQDLSPIPMTFLDLKGDYYKVLTQVAFFDGISKEDRARVCGRIRQLGRIVPKSDDPIVE